MTRPVALITGSGKHRVGAVVATWLAQRGYDLAIHYRTSAREADQTAASLRRHGCTVRAYQADLADESAVKAFLAAAVSDFGHIDVLVNSAAIWDRKPLEAVTADDVRRHFDINTLGTFLCCQHVGLQMVQQPTGGVIVNIGDWAEVRPYRDYAAYFPSKGGVTALTRALAVELGTRNPAVRVNAVLPGPVMLPPEVSAEERAAVIAATLVKREGRPENVAMAVLSLIENDFLTGVLLPVDGGRTIYAGD
jgi:pteridine reductase